MKEMNGRGNNPRLGQLPITRYPLALLDLALHHINKKWFSFMLSLHRVTFFKFCLEANSWTCLVENQINLLKKRELTHTEWSSYLRLFHYWLKTLTIQVKRRFESSNKCTMNWKVLIILISVKNVKVQNIKTDLSLGNIPYGLKKQSFPWCLKLFTMFSIN